MPPKISSRSDVFTIAIVFAIGLALVFGAHLYDRSQELAAKPIIKADIQGVDQLNITSVEKKPTREPITCEFVKIHNHRFAGPQTVTYIGDDADASRKQLIDCAEETIRPGTDYVYFFTDRSKASEWAPSTFWSNDPEMEGVIGRAYQDKPGEFMYTPKNKW